jgi:hypothetical protein
LFGVGCLLAAAGYGADAPASSTASTPIDRHAMVMRHNPVLHEFDVRSPLSVGNGEFCFTADATGLQTFPDAYAKTFPLCTMSDWGWHSFPNPQNYSMDTFAYKNYDAHGRPVGYAEQIKDPSSDFLRENPQRFNLGQIGFVLTKADGTPAQITDITGIEQTLDMWNGVLHSHFIFDGQPVDVQTVSAATPEPNFNPKSYGGPNTPRRPSDIISVRVDSPLVSMGHLAIQIRFPYASAVESGSDWNKPDAHNTELHLGKDTSSALIVRTLDDAGYSIMAYWSAGAALKPTEVKHTFILSPAANSNTLEFTGIFDGHITPSITHVDLNGAYGAGAYGAAPSTAGLNATPTFADVKAAAQTHWHQFWSTGGAIDLSQSKDPRWNELERRIVLSEYLTAIQSTGKNPPAETGLTLNSWYGKFHMEMYWWHDAHFALWGRAPLLENSLGYYQRILPQATANAKRQGYDGARWPKMTDPSGIDTPSSVGAFLIWQEPHPIYLAELDYRAHPDQATLEKFKDVIFATANFMCSYAWWDEAKQRYELGPPLLEAQEDLAPKNELFNPTYELVYWRWGLETAQQWRTRLGLPRDENWDKVLQKLSAPTIQDGKYLFAESLPDTYTNPKWISDHPAVLNAYGVLPGPGIDPVAMKNTFDWIWANWNWPTTWGWDYPALAMCAARLGEPERAVDALLLDTPKNHYVTSGHNFQRDANSNALPLYLPGNGGLLTAVAMMAAGWDGAPKRNAPGFPDNGQWVVRWEGLLPLP